MGRNFNEIAEDALKLPQDEQLRLARALLERIEAKGDIGAVPAWENEIQRRIELVDSGFAEGRPFVDVICDIDRQLTK